MKKISLILSVITALLFGCLISCVPSESEASILYKGNHVLRKMGNSKIETPSTGSAFFILGIGWANGSGGTTEESITFAWLNNKGEYVITKLPLCKIRIKIEMIENPYVKFRWSDTPFGADIIYAVVVCKDSDWPQNINMPLNGAGN